MSEETSNSDWALVTQDGEIEEESEDDGSYSGSSIELLTSDEDTDNGVDGDTNERRAGPFFVLRLKSKEFLAESDSDEKEGPVDSLSKEEVSHVSSDKGGQVDSEVDHPTTDIGCNRSKPEHLLPNSSDTNGKSYHELLRTNSSDSSDRSEPELLQPDSSDINDRSAEPEALQAGSTDNGEKSEPEPQSNFSDSGESNRSEPEFLQPDSSENAEQSELDLIQPTTDDSNENEHLAQEGTSLGTSLSNLKETVRKNPNVIDETMEEINVTSLSSEISEGTSSVSDTVTEVVDNTLVTHSQGNIISSESDIPDALSPEVKLGDQDISMGTGEVTSVNTENDSSHEPADDLKDVSSIDTSSLESSSFSLLNDDVDESKNIEDNENDGNFTFIDHGDEIDSSSRDITIIQKQEQQRNNTKEHGEHTITYEPLNKSIPVDHRKSTLRRRARIILVLFEVFWVVVIFLGLFFLGYYQGSTNQAGTTNLERELYNENYDLGRSLETAKDELDIFYGHFNEIKKLKENFELNGLDPKRVDWMNSFSFSPKTIIDLIHKCESARELDKKLYDLEQYMVRLLTTTFDNIKLEEQTKQDRHSEEINNLKRQINNMKNEKSDLEKDIVELGKKKYLAGELEDENLALIKRISDMESQLMDAEDQSYVLQLQISKLQKKSDTQVNNEDNVGVLKQKLEALENQRKYLADQVIHYKDTIEGLKIEKRSAEITEAERWKVENMELKNKWSGLSIKVQSLEKELSKAYRRISELENELIEVKTVKPDISYDFFKSQDEHQIQETMQSKQEKERLDAENVELQDKLADIKEKYERLLKKQGVDISPDDSSEEEESIKDETEADARQTADNLKNPEVDRPVHGKANKKGKNGSGKQEDTSRNEELHKSWSDAMNEILNKTKSSMVNVSKQIQDTLSQVKNLSQELWKKHEPKVNQILSNTYENVKKNVNKVTEKVTKATIKILEKSAKWMKKYRKGKKNRRGGNKYHDHDSNYDSYDSDQSTYTASTGKRQYRSDKKHDNHDYYQKTNDNHDYDQQQHNQKFNSDQNHDNQQSHDHDYYQDYDSDFHKFNQPYHSPGFLENELQSLNDSVEYINTLRKLSCNDMIDIMEDFQDFKKVGGLKILSEKEKSWFFCQKSWFESMVYSDPSIEDSECIENLGQRQIAAIHHRCCPCLGQYGNYIGKFCIKDGCSHQKPIDKKWDKKGKKKKEGSQVPEQDQHEKNKTAEEEMFKNQGNFVYCDPFSHDLDCGDESWYLKRMKERDHLRKYRMSSKTDWLFKRADDREYERTKPDDWYFNRMGGGQAYHAYQDDKWYDENWYIRKIHGDKKNHH